MVLSPLCTKVMVSPAPLSLQSTSVLFEKFVMYMHTYTGTLTRTLIPLKNPPLASKNILATYFVFTYNETIK